MLRQLFPQKRYYLDYAASTPVSKEIMCSMSRFWSVLYANPNSIHRSGKNIAELVRGFEEMAKKNTNANKKTKIVWTSGGTESNQLALQTAIKSWKKNNTDTSFLVLVSHLEHASVLNYLESLDEPLMEIVYINLKKNGKLDLGHVRLLLEQNENIALLSLQLQSSQIGVTQELKKIGELKKNTFPTIHIDASQGVFYNNVNMQDWNADTLTICAQKIHGPKGSGILLCKPDRVPVREGTPAAPLIAGVSHALTEAQKNTHKHALLIQTRRKELFQELRRLKVNFVCNGEEEVDSLVVNMSFPKDTRDSEQMIIAFDQVGLEVSSKSACMGSQAQDSILLSSMGLKQNNSVRISLHHDLGSGDIKKIAKRIKSVVR